MSAASTPAPRSKSSSESRPSSPRHSLFVPVFILMLGLGALTVYQVMSLEEQLDEITQAVDKYDVKVKLAQYERAKFYLMARQVLSLAPRDPSADQIAVTFNLRKLQTDEPELMNAGAPSDLAAASNPPPATTNAAPAEASTSTSTNAAPANPAAK